MPISGYAPPHFALFIIIWGGVAFVLNFFSSSFSCKPYDVNYNRYMLNCFLFEKFYLHCALCDFDSTMLHCTKLCIRQSINREQIFDVTFEPSPLHHWKILRTPLSNSVLFMTCKAPKRFHDDDQFLKIGYRNQLNHLCFFIHTYMNPALYVWLARSTQNIFLGVNIWNSFSAGWAITID